jgi:hypothetical protein
MEPLMQPAMTCNRKNTCLMLSYIIIDSLIVCILLTKVVANKSQLTSLWPPRYFVAECRTRSAPRARAFWLRGVAKVPSMQTKAPFLWQSSETSLMSTHLRNGLVGDSVKKSETCMKIQCHPNSGLRTIPQSNDSLKDNKLTTILITDFVLIQRSFQGSHICWVNDGCLHMVIIIISSKYIVSRS